MNSAVGVKLKPAYVKGNMTLFMQLLGGVIICAALVSFFTQMSLPELLTWLSKVFSVGFVSIYIILLATGIFAFNKINGEAKNNVFWFELGQHAANGVATLALTFTLLGISLGIGALSEQTLTPETVQQIIGQLTKQFSMAFMTTVIGLPTAAVLRAMVSLRYTKTLEAVK